jgi:hypothetical protein
MKQQVEYILKQQGYSPLFASIDQSIRDLKQSQYTRAEIKETLLGCYGIDQKLINYINSKA